LLRHLGARGRAAPPRAPNHALGPRQQLLDRTVRPERIVRASSTAWYPDWGLGLPPVAVAYPGSTVYVPDLNDTPRYGTALSKRIAYSVNGIGSDTCEPNTDGIGASFTPPFKLSRPRNLGPRADPFGALLPRLAPDRDMPRRFTDQTEADAHALELAKAWIDGRDS
jgi:hypothetical protein